MAFVTYIVHLPIQLDRLVFIGTRQIKIHKEWRMVLRSHISDKESARVYREHETTGTFLLLWLCNESTAGKPAYGQRSFQSAER